MLPLLWVMLLEQKYNELRYKNRLFTGLSAGKSLERKVGCFLKILAVCTYTWSKCLEKALSLGHLTWAVILLALTRVGLGQQLFYGISKLRSYEPQIFFFRGGRI